jgi:transcriptional regulator GlxA family with amidase domain
MDMSLALIERDFGPEVATKLAKRLEYTWNQDSTVDPFEAKI